MKIMKYFESIIPRSSKRTTKKELYKYYAGFSEEFVEDILEQLKLPKDNIILDPWNGSGTTTYIATKLGYTSYGIDINPIMTILSKARLHSCHHNSMEISKIIKQAKLYRTRVNEDDLLNKWFDTKTISYFRNIERSILEGKRIQEYNNDYSKIDVEKCFYILILINTIKRFIKTIKSSNPSWIKQVNLLDDEKISVIRSGIDEAFNEEFLSTITIIKNKNTLNKFELCNLLIGKSENINLPSKSINCIITSPPYCTRIDYAVLTNLELALAGISEDEFNNLRHQLTGGPVIHDTLPEPLTNWGQLCLNTLHEIKNHHSRASESYYYKTYLQYFDSMYKSFVEMNRVLMNNSYCIIVVQNSFYKDIYIDLSKIFEEFSLNFKWKLVKTYQFDASKNLTKTNKGSAKYKKNKVIKEYTLIFYKGDH